MSRAQTEPGHGMLLHARNPRLVRWASIALGLVAALLFVVLSPTRDAAADSETVTIVPAAGGEANLLDVANSSFADVQTRLGAGNVFTIPVGVPGLEAIPSVPVESTIDGTNLVIALESAAGDWFGTDSPLDTLQAEIMLLAQWDSAADVAPDIALAIRLQNVELGEIIPAWTGIAGVADTFELADAVVVLNPGGPFTLDPATLPGAVNDFLGVDGPLDEAVVIDQVAELLAHLDLSQNAIIAKVAAFFGIDPNEALLLAGDIAGTAEFLFDAAAEFEEGNFEIDGPIVLETPSNLPWLDRAAPAFRLRIEPDGTPSVFIEDEITITTGPVTNTFLVSVSLEDAQDLSITVNASAGNVPYGLDTLGTLTLETFTLTMDEATEEFAAAFDGTLDIDGAADVSIAVNGDPASTTGIVTVDGPLSLASIVGWLSGGAFGGVSYDQLNITGATVDEIEFSFDSTLSEDVFGLYGVISGADVLGASGIRSQLLIGLDRDAGETPVLLVALRIDDPGCGANCIDVKQILDIPNFSLTADLTLPAVNFAAVVPDNQPFSATKLGPNARAFLEMVKGEPVSDAFTLDGELNFIADIPIDGLNPLLAELGVTPAAPTIHVEGSAGFNLSYLNGEGSATLEDFRVEGTLAGLDADPIEGFPSWLQMPSTGEWRLYLAFAEGEPGSDLDDTLEIGAAIEGITAPDLFPGASVRLDASFAGTVAGPNPDWTVTARAGLDEEWEAPFGITFLTVNDAYAQLIIDQPEGESLTATAELCGTFEISPVVTTVCFTITSADPVNATFSISLDEAITLGELEAALPDLLGGMTLPGPVASAFVGPGELSFTVLGTGEFSINAVIAGGFEPTPGNPIGVDLMFSASFGGAGTPTVAVGIQPHPGITLGDLVGQPNLPVDLPLTPDVPGAGGFAFVYTTGAFDPDAPALPQAVRDWFLPLYAGDATGFNLPAGPSVIGAIALPEPLGEFVSTLGVDPNVLVGGSLSLDPIAVDLSLTMRVRAGVLPEFVDGANLTLTVGLELDPAPSLFFELNGDLYLKFKQGMDAELASQLQSIGVTLPAALPVNPGDGCPRGGFNLKSGDDNLNYCYDRLRLTAGMRLEVSVSPSPTVSVLAYGNLVSQNTGGQFWSPLGIEEVGIGSLGAEVEISFTAGPPFSLNLKLGLFGDVSFFEYNVSAGIKVGVSVFPAPTPAGVGASPNFDGLRISLPDGLETQDIIDLSNAIADAVGAPQLADPDPATFPNIALKNLYFSISPFGAPTICIQQGLVFRGDLYINPDPGLDFTGGPPCDPREPSTQSATYPVGPGESCADKKAQGCVGQAIFSLTPQGLIAEVYLADFEITPLQIRFDETVLQVKITLLEQYIRMSGGVEIGPGGAPVAIGRMAIDIQPFTLTFAGQLKVFDFNALVQGEVDANPLELFTGEGPQGLQLLVVLSGPELALPEFASSVPDFSTEVAADLQGTIQDITETVTLVIETLEAFQSDPLGTVLGLDSPWAEDLQTAYDDTVATLEALGLDTDFSLYDLLNGFTIGATYGRIADTIVGPVCTPVGGDGAVCELTPPITFLSTCETIIPGADHPCDEEEVIAAINGVFVDQVEAALAFAGLDGADALDQLIEDFDSLSGARFFGLHCASARVAITGLDENSVGMALDATVFGQDLDFGFTWDFNDPVGSALKLLEGYFSGAESGLCEGVDPALFGPGGLGNPDGTAAGELPPLRVGVVASPGLVYEGDGVEAVVSFDRPVETADGARNVTLDWGDGTSETVTFAPGTQSASRTHTYDDDDPTGTTWDVYVVRATDQAAGGSSHFDPVVVRNVAPGALAVTLDETGINEDHVVELTVAWDDPGADTFEVRIDWGDGSVEFVETVATQVIATHRYLDDRPTGTAGPDPANIKVRVRDDDGGQVFGGTNLTVSNVPPAASSIVLSPDSVNEGEPVTFSVTFEDVGTLDTHYVLIDWEGDGTFDAGGFVGTSRMFEVEHTFPDDDPTATPFDVLKVRIVVGDDDSGVADVTRALTINNVAPTVCVGIDPEAAAPDVADCPAAAHTILEGGAIDLDGVFADPGWPDSHTVVIDWGDPALPDTVLAPQVGVRSFSASQVYGDNGVYTITATVTDDDTGVGVATATVTVLNVDPTLTLNETEATSATSGGTILADGPDDDGVLSEPTFVVRAGTELGFSATSTDPGSDDLTFTWDWDSADAFDPATHVTSSLVNEPDFDPFPSPTNQPRDVTTTATHSWTQACLYQVELLVEDDDGGSASDGTYVVVTGTDSRIRAPGYWYNEYDISKRNSNSLSIATLDCYLQITRHMSRVFNTWTPIGTFEQARGVLNTRQTSDDRDIMTRQLLAAWLNFAHGSIGWFDMVDTDGDRRGDKTFGQLLLESEQLRMDATATRSELLAQESILKRVNNER